MLDEMRLTMALDIESGDSSFLFKYKKDKQNDSDCFRLCHTDDSRIYSSPSADQIKDLIVYLKNYLAIIESEKE